MSRPATILLQWYTLKSFTELFRKYLKYTDDYKQFFLDPYPSFWLAYLPPLPLNIIIAFGTISSQLAFPVSWAYSLHYIISCDCESWLYSVLPNVPSSPFSRWALILPARYIGLSTCSTRTLGDCRVYCIVEYAKVFSAKFRAWRPLVRQKRVIHESFLCENHIFHQFAKIFSLENFPLYGTVRQCSQLLTNT